MKKRCVFVIKLCVLFLLCSCASYLPTNNEFPMLLSSTAQAISNLELKVNNSKNNNLKEAYDELTKNSALLFPLLEACNKKYALSEEYIVGIKESKNILVDMESQFETTSNKAFILEAISKDYNAKQQSINNSKNKAATEKVRVTVNSAEEEGFFVYGKLSYEQAKDIKRYRFNKPTQNASEDFVPGYYLFWLEKDQRIGKPELYLIMSDGTDAGKDLILKTP